jgi:hypothetical protein
MKKYKIALYCQVGKSLDMAQFSIQSAVKNLGMPIEDVKLIFICWKTSKEVYQWLQVNEYHHVDMIYDEGKGFLWNLYKGWNLGYTEGYKFADYVCPIATDHAFYKNWLANMYQHARPNRIVNCKLIEPGTLPTLHTAINFGVTKFGEFNYTGFQNFCASLVEENRGKIATDEKAYGHRFDAMPFICPIDVWERFGPMLQTLNDQQITGDTDFFDRCQAGGVEIVKSLDGISYHSGGAETRVNAAAGVYT